MQAGHVVCVTALFLVQDGSRALGLPVTKKLVHVFCAVIGAVDETRFVADCTLFFIDACNLLLHDCRANLHVTHRVVAVGFSIGIPHGHAVRHEFTHGRLVIIVTNNTASDAGGARADGTFFHHNDVAIDTLATRFHFQCKVIGGAQPMDTGTEDDETCTRGDTHCDACVISSGSLSLNLSKRWTV